jgi:hypothetical protein
VDPQDPQPSDKGLSKPPCNTFKSFKILINHRNLRYFYTEKQLTKRQIRWSEYLSGFNFKLEWRPGSQGGRPDALSRREQDLPADGADERIRARFQRLFRKNQLPVKMNVMQPTNASELNQNMNAEFFNYSLKVPLFEDQRL